MSFEEKLEEEIINIVSKWNDTGIFAISFLVTVNQLSNYKGIDNFPEFSVGYNTENNCNDAGLLGEKRWNFAYWPQNNNIIIDANHSGMADELIDWYLNNGVVDIGRDAEDEMYDKNGNYIGKGPRGYWELLSLISDVARKIQLNGEIRQRFGEIPIIVHDLEYSWYTLAMTKNANPNDEAKDVLDYLLNISGEQDD